MPGTTVSGTTHTRGPTRRGFVLTAAFAVALLLVFHPPALAIGGEWKLPGYDATRVFWADLAFMRRCLLGGELPLWNPYDRAGYAFVAEPQSGFFDPITWLVVLISVPLGGVPAWMISLKALLYYVLAATGVYALVEQRARAWSRPVPGWAIGVGVMVYVVGGRMDKLKDQSGLWPSAWAPWLLLALAWAIERPSWRRGVVLGLVGGQCLLSGYPPLAVRLALLMLAPLGLLWTIQAAREREDKRAFALGLAACLGAAALVCACLVAGQVVATMQVLPMTIRAKLSLSEVLSSQIELVHGLGLLAPGPTMVSALLYAGVVAGIACLAAIMPRRPGWGERALWLALGVFGFLLACGQNGPVLPLLAELPGFRSFRIAGHFIVLASVASALLVPFGLVNLVEGGRASKLVGSLLAAVGLFVFSTRAHEPSDAALLAVFASVAVLVVQMFLPPARARLRERLGWALLVLICVDVFHGNRHIAEVLQPVPDTRRASILADARDDPDTRIADFGWANNRPGPNLGVRDFVGARPALTDRHYMALYREAQRSHGILQAMGVERAAFARPLPVRRRLRIDPATSGERRAVFEVVDPWPRAFWTTQLDLHRDEQPALRALRSGGARAVAFGADAAALTGLREQLAAAELEPRTAALELRERGVNRSTVALPQLDHPALVVINEAWDPGWRAWVDGEAVALHRVNHVHRAVIVPAGARELELRYRPPGVRALVLLWLITLIGGGVIAARTLRDDRRQERDRHPAEEPTSPSSST